MPYLFTSSLSVFIFPFGNFYPTCIYLGHGEGGEKQRKKVKLHIKVCHQDRQHESLHILSHFKTFLIFLSCWYYFERLWLHDVTSHCLKTYSESGYIHNITSLFEPGEILQLFQYVIFFIHCSQCKITALIWDYGRERDALSAKKGSFNQILFVWLKSRVGMTFTEPLMWEILKPACVGFFLSFLFSPLPGGGDL